MCGLKLNWSVSCHSAVHDRFHDGDIGVGWSRSTFIGSKDPTQSQSSHDNPPKANPKSEKAAWSCRFQVGLSIILVCGFQSDPTSPAVDPTGDVVGRSGAEKITQGVRESCSKPLRGFFSPRPTGDVVGGA